jgi:hypothetical protein
MIQYEKVVACVLIQKSLGSVKKKYKIKEVIEQIIKKIDGFKK